MAFKTPHANRRNNVQRSVVIFSSVVWNFYRTRPHEMAFGFQHSGFDVTFVEPLVYPGATSTRLQAMVDTPANGVHVVERRTTLRKGVVLLAVENIRNAVYVVRNRPYAVVSGDIWMSTLAALACRLLRIPFFFDNMDYWPAVEQSRPMQWLVRHVQYPLLGRLSAAVFNTSHFLQQHMQRYAKRSLYIPNAKSAEAIAAAESTPRDAARIHHRVVFVATLRDWYDYDLLVAVFAQLPQVQLDIYGDGPMKQALINAAQPYANIAVHNPVDSSEVARLVGMSDFGVLPLQDTPVTKGVFPIKLLDYWLAKKPVLATPYGDLPVLAHTGGGLVLQRTHDQWVQTIADWYANPGQLGAQGAQGYARVGEEFSYAILMPTIVAECERYYA